MTLRQLAKRVDFWLKELAPLGLCHWQFHVSINDEVETDPQIPANASCTCSSHYDTVWLEFRKSYIDEVEQDELDKTIVHELLHATMRDLDHVIEGVSEYLGAPHRDAYAEAAMHAREGFVEKIARSIVYANGRNVVR